MELLRQRLLEFAVKQSDLIEVFSAIDRDCSGRISFDEFRLAVKSLEVGIHSNDEIKRLFQQFDTTNNGQIDLSEFLQQLRPPMNERRQKAVYNLFDSLDVNKDGKLTLSDFKIKYACQLKSDKQRLNRDIENIFRNFLKKFHIRDKTDGSIDKERFLHFCSILSTTVKEDVYFEHALRTLFDFRFN